MYWPNSWMPKCTQTYSSVSKASNAAVSDSVRLKGEAHGGINNNLAMNFDERAVVIAACWVSSDAYTGHYLRRVLLSGTYAALPFPLKH